MIVQFPEVDIDTMKQLEQLKEEYPEVVLRTIDAGADGSLGTQLIVAIIPAIIEALGAIVAAFIATRSKTEKETIVIIIDIGDGRKHKIHKVEDWEKIKEQILRGCKK